VVPACRRSSSPHHIGQLPVLEESIDANASASLVSPHHRANRAAHPRSSHNEPEPVLPAAYRTVQESGRCPVTPGPKSIATRGGDLFRRRGEVVHPCWPRHHRLGGQRHDLGHRTHERGLPTPKATRLRRSWPTSSACRAVIDRPPADIHSLQPSTYAPRPSATEPATRE